MMRKRGKGRQLFSMLLAVMMVLSMTLTNGVTSLTVYAEESQTTGAPTEEMESETDETGAETKTTAEAETTGESPELSETPESREEQTEPTESETGADETESRTEETTAESETAEKTTAELEPIQIDTGSLPGSDELFEGYVMQKFYGDNGISLYGAYGESRLSGNELSVYNELKAKIASVANGQETSTAFSIDLNDKDIYYDIAGNKISNLDVDSVIFALLADCPYELYWFDSSGSGVKTDCKFKASNRELYELKLSFSVSAAYAGSGEYTVDTAKTGATSKAVENARAIVDANADKSAEDKLAAYRDAICKLVSYDSGAAGGTDTSGGNAWQLVSVFDDDPSTNVVCEGYSKAFQYLCDMGGLTCYSVSGTMNGGTGAGAHMWNIVVLDGQSYLVDVTNCDEGTVGQYGGLFLVGAPNGTAEGYTIHIPSHDLGNGSYTVAADVTYTYDENTISLYSADIRTLAGSDTGNEPEPDMAVRVTFSDGTTKVYEDVTTAWTEAQGQTATILLLKSQTVTQALTVDNANSDITLEMEDGVTLSGDISGNGILDVRAGSLTLASGTVHNTSSSTSAVYGIYVRGTGDGGSFYMTGGTVIADMYTGIGVSEAGKAYISGGSVTAPTYGIFVNLSGYVNVSGTAVIKAVASSPNFTGVSCGICVYGSDSDAVIDGGSVSGGNTGLYVYAGAEATVNEGHIFSTSTSAEARPCGAVVNGAEKGLAEGEITVNGGTIEGYFCGMNIGGHATINDGTFKVISTDSNGFGLYILGGLDMFGGSVNGGAYGLAVAGTKNSDNTITITGTVNLSGGSFYGSQYAVFNNLTNGTVRALLGEEKAYYEGDVASGIPKADGLDGKGLSGTFTVGECTHVDGDNDGACDICGFVQEKNIATVEKDGVEQNFTDINKAWKAALDSTDASPATLTLLESVNMEDDSKLEIPLNSSANIILKMADGVSLVGNINGQYNGVILVQGGTLTMESGIVENTYSIDGGNVSNYGVGVHVARTGTFNMEGGQVLATGSASAAGIKIRNSSNATVNITGGTVSGTYCGVEIKGGGILSISGDANVSCTSEEGMGVSCIASDSDYSATVNITGGTITGGRSTNYYGINLLSNKPGAVIKGKISGGNINISGIKASGADVNLDITGGTIDGGVLATESCTVNLSDCTVNGRTTGRDGHGISVSGGAEININSGVNIHTTTFESYGIHVRGGIANIYEGVTVEASDESFYSVYVYGADSTANIYGGSFTSTGRGNVYFENGGTVKDLLAAGCAYYDGTEVKAEKLIVDGLDAAMLTQSTVTVGACSHIDTNSDGSCDICGNEMPVATVSINDAVTEFDDINEAWEKALEGTDEAPATLTLLRSVDLKGSELEIPLNSSANIILKMAENVELSSSLEGARSGTGVIKISSGTLTMKSGIVKNPYSYENGASDVFYGVGVYVTRTGTFNMEGGQVLATGNGNAAGIKIGDDVSVKVNISGGTVSGTYSGVEAKSNINSVVNVSDNAQISCTAENGQGIFFYGSQLGEAELNVTGGTITGGSGGDTYGISVSYISAAITGGIISGIDIVSSNNVNISGATIKGTVRVNGGKADLSNCTINARTTGIDQHGISVFGGAEVNINSGVDIHTTAETSYGVSVDGYDGGTINISDGVTVNAGGSNSCGVYIYGERSTANIYGGSFTSNGRWGLNCQKGKVNLYGGTFYYNGTSTSYGAVTNISGMVKDLLAEGYAYYEGTADQPGNMIIDGLENQTLTQSVVTVKRKEKINPDIGEVSYDGTIYPSTPVENVILSRENESIPGTLTLAEDSVFMVGEGTYNWTFTPEDTENYNVITGTVQLTVTKDTLVRLEAEGTPDKTAYVYEDVFETDGLTVRAVYASGYTEDVTDEVTASELNAGDTSVVLSYTDGEGTKVDCTISDITVSKKVLDNRGMSWSEGTYTYDGTEQGPDLNGNLPEGVKATVSGNKATDAGSYRAEAVFELAEGYSSENYALAVENLPAEWSIERRPVTVTPDSGQSKAYGQAEPSLNYSADNLVEGEALSGELSREPGEGVGSYAITQGSLTDENNKNYHITFTEGVDFTIAEQSIADADIQVTGQFIYNGGEHRPTPIVTLDGIVLNENADYTVSYENNVNAGEAEVIITGIGSYAGEARKKFVVDKAEAGLAVSAVADKTWGDDGFKLDVSRNGDGNLTYESSDTSVLVVDEDGWVEIVGAGTATITVTDEGSANYYGDSKDVTVTVDKKNGTLTVVDFAYENVIYGDVDFQIGNIVSEGESVVQYESSNPSVVTVDENGRVNIVGAGTAVITLTMAESGNYYAADTTVTITVLPKTVTVTADSQTKVYGDRDAELTWKAEGLVGEDRLEGVEVTRKTGEDVGEYPITASQSGDANPNYDITFVDGSLTIQARDIADASVELGGGLTADGNTRTQTIRRVTVKNADGEALEATYTVTGNEGKEPGVYRMTLTGTGNFTGTVMKTFVIVPSAGSKAETDTNGNIVIGDGTIGTRTEEDEKAPEAEIGTDNVTLIEMLTENGDLTAEELSQTAEGADIRLILKVTGADDALSQESRAQIEKIASGYTIGRYMNVHLFKEISREGKVLNTVQLTETRDNITISVKVPEKLLNTDASMTRIFYIVRNHEGKAEFLPAVYNAADNTLTFETNKFSDFAIVYKDTRNTDDNKPGDSGTNKPNGNGNNTTTGNGKKPLNTATGTVPKTGDGMNLGLWSAVMLGALSIMLGIIVYGKRKKKQAE